MILFAVPTEPGSHIGSEIIDSLAILAIVAIYFTTEPTPRTNLAILAIVVGQLCPFKGHWAPTPPMHVLLFCSQSALPKTPQALQVCMNTGPYACASGSLTYRICVVFYDVR